jgi:hypothetical protein
MCSCVRAPSLSVRLDPSFRNDASVDGPPCEDEVLEGKREKTSGLRSDTERFSKVVRPSMTPGPESDPPLPLAPSPQVTQPRGRHRPLMRPSSSSSPSLWGNKHGHLHRPFPCLAVVAYQVVLIAEGYGRKQTRQDGDGGVLLPYSGDLFLDQGSSLLVPVPFACWGIQKTVPDLCLQPRTGPRRTASIVCSTVVCRCRRSGRELPPRWTAEAVEG